MEPNAAEGVGRGDPRGRVEIRHSLTKRGTRMPIDDQKDNVPDRNRLREVEEWGKWRGFPYGWCGHGPRRAGARPSQRDAENGYDWSFHRNQIAT